MYIDKQSELSLAQSIVGNAATAIASTNTYDTGLGATPFNGANASIADVGGGEPVKAFVNVDTTVVGGSGGIKIDYIQSAAADLSTPDVLASITTAATPAAGAVLMQMVIPSNTKRYVGFQYTPLTSNTTAGKVNAYLVKDVPTSIN
jgi:hypothetical protein